MNTIIELSELRSLFSNKVQFGYDFKNDAKELWLADNKSDSYVEPEFSFVKAISTCDKLEDAQVILVSAVGATGKSELTKALSFDLKMPVVDLGNAKVVASNSLTGLVFQYLQPVDGGELLQNLQRGGAAMIIDALDEGYQKTNTQGFFDFLDDVIRNVSNNSCSYIMLGRTNAIEMCSLYLDEKGIKVAVLQIEPFSLDKAQEFIDKRVCSHLSEQHKSAYQKTRDYVLKSLGDFFKTNDNMEASQYNNFIGYAPVLLAISEFLDGEKVKNYMALLEKLKSNKFKSISLILDIVNRILDRDKNDKIVPNLIRKIISNRDATFQKLALENSYTQEEQCARVLYILLGEAYPYKSIDDDAFDAEYTKGLDTWMLEHPFLSSRKPANVVFECYILAKLIQVDKYKDAVYRYMNINHINSFMFFFLYHELNKNQEISPDIIPYLYNSLKTLDSNEVHYCLEIEPSDVENDDIYEVAFVSSAVSEHKKIVNYSFQTILQDELRWHGTISDVSIDITKDFVINALRTDMLAPSYIHCKSFIVKSDEINFGCRNSQKNIVIEADDIVSDTVSGNVPKIHRVGCENRSLVFVCSERLSYPFCNFQKKKISDDVEMSSTMADIYNKMRRTLIMFRSHSKGQLAKHHAKIDNRIGNTPLGKAVVNALLDRHIIYREDHVYIIDNDSMDKYLGVKFDDIRSCTITDAMSKFLKDIECSLKK